MVNTRAVAISGSPYKLLDIIMEFKIKLANQVISVICQYEYTMKACKEYIINSENSIFTVCATDDEITAEIYIADETIDVGYAEFICLYRKIAEILPHYNCVVMHSAAITYKDSAILLLLQAEQAKAHILNYGSRHLRIRLIS